VPVAIRGHDPDPPPAAGARACHRVTVQIGPDRVAGRDIADLMAQVSEFLVKNVENVTGNRRA
jgi:hypothetical protein